jgi:hypothetical protein
MRHVPLRGATIFAGAISLLASADLAFGQTTQAAPSSLIVPTAPSR